MQDLSSLDLNIQKTRLAEEKPWMVGRHIAYH